MSAETQGEHLLAIAHDVLATWLMTCMLLLSIGICRTLLGLSSANSFEEHAWHVSRPVIRKSPMDPGS